MKRAPVFFRILTLALILPLGAAIGSAGCSGSIGPTKPAQLTPATSSSSMSQSATSPIAPALRDIYGKAFFIGAAIPASVLASDSKKAILEKNFNSFTCENEMKPQSLLGSIATMGADGMPVLDFTTADRFCAYALLKGFRMRGHTLVWHSQTPSWFFREGFQPGGKEVAADEMLTRMEWYIRSVLGHFQTAYPGLIYAWDVVNEAAADSGGVWRTESPWYRIIGQDFVTKAFEYARKYVDSGVALFYNDYNLHIVRKADAVAQIVEPAAMAGTIDGIGMQGHEQLSDFLSAAV
ncbi:MAG TPA: endo-1,4-beta-xylanase, partial [Clostridia bacterium]